MRALVSTVLALACLLALAASADGGQRHIYSLTFNEVGVDGHHRRVLSRHDIFPEAASLSPDHRQFAYAPYFYDGARSDKLRVADVYSARDRLLVQAPSWITDLAWAPNGRTIALTVSGPAPPGVNGIWLVGADGTDLRRVADAGYELTWSPDSKSLAMDRLDDQLRGFITVLSIETGVTHDVATGFRPRWSPDGKLLVFEASPGRNNEALKIRIVPADGGQPRTLGRGTWPAWSPDGRTIAFFLPRQGKPGLLRVVPVRGGRAKTVVWASASAFAWSPNGRKLAYVVLGPREDGQPLRRSVLRIVGANGGVSRRLTAAYRSLAPLAWSRNSSSLLYSGLYWVN